MLDSTDASARHSPRQSAFQVSRLHECNNMLPSDERSTAWRFIQDSQYTPKFRDVAELRFLQYARLESSPE